MIALFHSHAYPLAILITAGVIAGIILAIHQQIVYWCTILHNILPPWDFLNEFPGLLRYYRLFVYLVGWGAGNTRSTFWRSISTKDGSTISPAMTKRNGT